MTEAQGTPARSTSRWTPPGGTLGELLAATRQRLLDAPLDEAALRAAAARVTKPPSFRTALRRDSVAVIAEVKRSSPSKGPINRQLSAVPQAEAYVAGGAAAISVLTEPTRFGGTAKDLRMVTAALALGHIPVLRKDFLLEPVQLYESRALGAAAVLLIARAMPPLALCQLMRLAEELGLDALIEVRDERELEMALGCGASMVGVNNRDLESLEIDPSRSERVIPMIPSGVTAVAESGFESAGAVRRAAAAGADAVLVGSLLSAAADPISAVEALTGVRRQREVRAAQVLRTDAPR